MPRCCVIANWKRRICQVHQVGLAEGLHYVYVGNLPGEADTFCHSCGRLLIRRIGFLVVQNHIGPGGCCLACGTRVPGVGMKVTSRK